MNKALRHFAIGGQLWCKKACGASPGRCAALLLSACGVAVLLLEWRKREGGELAAAESPVVAAVAAAAALKKAGSSGGNATDAGGKLPSAVASLRGRARREAPAARPLVPGGMVPPMPMPTAETPIYLTFSAFRDGVRCARTLGFALEKAKHPQRLHFRVLQAMSEERHDVSCAEAFMSKYLGKFCRRAPDDSACRSDVLSRIKIWTIPLEEGMGPAHQRGLLNELLDYEASDALCLTTDSHMDFFHNWDELTVADWLLTENEFAVLTAYPMSMGPSQEKEYSHWHVDLCGYFLENGIPRGKTGGTLSNNPGDKPYFTMNWAAGLSFHRCHADHNVPVDKHLRYIFTGEEVSRAVRLWTHGYDLYLPSTVTIVHDYSHAKQDFWKFSREGQAEDTQRSRERLAALLKLDGLVAQPLPVERLAPYGLGDQRTLEQYIEWSRIDLGTPRWAEFLLSKGIEPVEKQTAEGGHQFCQTLKRVPVKDVHRLNASIATHGRPPGADPESSPAKRAPLRGEEGPPQV